MTRDIEKLTQILELLKDNITHIPRLNFSAPVIIDPTEHDLIIRLCWDCVYLHEVDKVREIARFIRFHTCDRCGIPLEYRINIGRYKNCLSEIRSATKDSNSHYKAYRLNKLIDCFQKELLIYMNAFKRTRYSIHEYAGNHIRKLPDLIIKLAEAMEPDFPWRLSL